MKIATINKGLYCESSTKCSKCPFNISKCKSNINISNRNCLAWKTRAIFFSLNIISQHENHIYKAEYFSIKIKEKHEE